MSRQSMKARRALRSAAARKGWETRKRNRELAEFDRQVEAGRQREVVVRTYRSSTKNGVAEIDLSKPDSVRRVPVVVPSGPIAFVADGIRVTDGAGVSYQLVKPPTPATDANPWPRVVAAVRRVVGGFVGWLR
jgi:hypothetical protein